MFGPQLVKFHSEHGLEPTPRLTSNPQPPFTVAYSTRSTSVRRALILRRLKLAGYAAIAAGGMWIAFQLLDILIAPFRP